MLFICIKFRSTIAVVTFVALLSLLTIGTYKKAIPGHCLELVISLT